MAEKDITITRAGLKLAAKVSVPDTDKYDLVIFMYGFGGPKMPKNANTLIPDLAKTLQKQNLGTIIFDFAGHNQSEGNISDMTIFNQIEDANKVLQYALQLKGVNHIYLLGHSQGGVVASMLAGYYADKISKLVLLAPAATLVDDARLGKSQGETYDPHHIPDKLRIHQEWDLNGFYFRTAQFLNVYDVAQNFRGPVLDLHGAADKIINNYASRHYQAIYDNCEFHLIPNGDHGLHVGRDEVMSRVVNFLAK